MSVFYYFYCVIVVLLIFFLYFDWKYDDLDRYCIKLLLKHRKFLVSRAESVKKGALWNAMKVLFGNKYQLAIITEGAVYNGLYLLEHHRELFERFDRKLEWAKVFHKYGINHPKILYKCMDGKLIEGFNDEMVLKPENGRLGDGVKKIKSVPTCDNRDIGKDWIIQELLKDCDSERSRHYRIVTFHNGDIHCVCRLDAVDSNIASNHGQGGKATLVYSPDRNINNVNEKILNVGHQLGRLHIMEFDYVFSIGWDVLLHCEKSYDYNRQNKIPYVLEGNFLHGGSWFDLDKNCSEEDKRTIDDYKKRALKFHKENNYL